MTNGRVDRVEGSEDAGRRLPPAPDAAAHSFALGLSEAAARVRMGALSPETLVDEALSRIQLHDGAIRAFIGVFSDRARQEAAEMAREARDGALRGPLHGVPIAVKDLFATVDAPTTFGSPHFAGFPERVEAAAVARLRESGAIILGKTNLDEFAFGSTNANPHFGQARNPWNLAYHPGGSSGGSAAAVAAGFACAALGTDTGVSIRQPAACCGIVGLKPTLGLVSRRGAAPLSPSLDHVGPMTRSVADAALMLTVLAGHDPLDPASAYGQAENYVAALSGSIAGATVGALRRPFFEDCDPEVVAAVDRAVATLTGLGATVRDLDLPLADEANRIASVIASSEAAAYHADDLDQRPWIFNENLLAWLRGGQRHDAARYQEACRLRRRLVDEMRTIMAPFDAFVLPTSPVAATPIADGFTADETRRWRNTGPFLVLDTPAISVPCGLTSRGLPIGLQIVGKPFREGDLLRIANAYEQASGWRIPNLPPEGPAGPGKLPTAKDSHERNRPAFSL